MIYQWLSRVSLEVFGLNYIFSIILSPGGKPMGLWWGPTQPTRVVEGSNFAAFHPFDTHDLTTQNLQIEINYAKNMSSKERMARWKDLGFTWNLPIGSRCWSFQPLQPAVHQSLGTPLRFCSNECRGDVVSLLLYRGRLPVGAALMLRQCCFCVRNGDWGHNSMRWQRCLMEEAGG